MADSPQEPPDLSGYLSVSKPRPVFGEPVSAPADASGISSLMRLMLGTGLFKDRAQASYALLGFSIIVIILSLAIFYFMDAGDTAEIKAPPGRRIINTSEAPPRLDYAFP